MDMDIYVLKVSSGGVDGSSKNSFNENVQAAEQALLEKGLIVGRVSSSESGVGSVGSPWHCLWRFIVVTYFELDHQQGPLSIKLLLSGPQPAQQEPERSLYVMPRTEFLFYILTRFLISTVVMFSSWSLPAVYDPPQSINALLFFTRLMASREVILPGIAWNTFRSYYIGVFFYDPCVIDIPPSRP
ncbi:MAG: hypothetical protein J3R72DRAFT_499981 [Linnemannia gamsii]|nr:MAG: hypothetical protein J3R72DRAFT_499981 [Linnemannia gamsii]